MRRFLKIVVFFVAILAAILLVIGLSLNETLPEGKSGDEAEQLADEMLNALNKEAYDSLEVLEWTFPRGHHFVWYKREKRVLVSWEDYKVDLNTLDRTGTATYQGTRLSGDNEKQALEKAWSMFANDSFWLVAPYKVRDPGTVRKIVQTKQGTGLLVTYTSGGVTPGDSYLWILNADNIPVKWKMWVSIIPVGGIEFTWEDWQQHGGAWFAPIHVGPMGASVNLTDLRIK